MKFSITPRVVAPSINSITAEYTSTIPNIIAIDLTIKGDLNKEQDIYNFLAGFGTGETDKTGWMAFRDYLMETRSEEEYKATLDMLSMIQDNNIICQSYGIDDNMYEENHYPIQFIFEYTISA